MNKKKNMSRRSFLKNCAEASACVGASPVLKLMSAIYSGQAFQSLAQSTTNMNYIHIQQPGAPSRWMYDLFLTPFSGDSAKLVTNPMVATKFIENGGRLDSVEYQTVLQKGIQVPYMWQYAVPSAAGGTVPMAQLLDNLLHIRGINTGNAAHDGSQANHMRPLAADKSITALTADASSLPFSAIDAGTSNYQFQSSEGKSPVNLQGTTDLLNQLLDPFINRAPSAYLNDKDLVANKVTSALDSLENMALAGNESAQIVVDSRKSAETLMAQGFGDIDQTWTDLLAKYTDLINRSIDRATLLENINNLPVGTSGTRGAAYINDSAENVVTTADLRDLIVQNTTVFRMAEHFAVAEYVVLNNLSSSLAIAPGSFLNLTNQGNAQTTQNYDEHLVGQMPSLYLNFMIFRAVSACLIELINQLKSNNLFDRTVIDFSAEFNRSPRANLSGSDHGWQGKSTCIYSGKVSGPMILGNIYADAPLAGYPGTWGYGAPVQELGKEIDLNHLGSTLAYLLDVQTPIRSANSLVIHQGESLISTIEKAKIV